MSSKHCKYEDEGLFVVAPDENGDSWSTWLTRTVFGTACSNCRTSDNPCLAFGGGDPKTTDTKQAGITAGVVGVGCIALIGSVAFARRRKFMGPTEELPSEVEVPKGGADTV